jgi:hypothetical protein
MDTSSVPQVRPDTRVRRFRGVLLVAMLGEEYDIPLAEAVEDTAEFLADLADGGVIELIAGGAP